MERRAPAPPVARLQVKVLLDAPADLDLEPAIALFHGWIQRDAVEGLLIDVADYRHVHDGPGVVLIGDERDYGLDLGGGRPGVVCIEKRHAKVASLADQLAEAARRARGAARLLVESPAFASCHVRDDELEVRVLDRLQAPAGRTGEAAVLPSVERVAHDLLGGRASVEAVPAPKGPVTLRLIAA